MGILWIQREQSRRRRPLGVSRAQFPGTFSPASLTPFQLTAILVNTMVGVGVLVLPRVLATRAGTGAWVAVVGGGLGVLLLSGAVMLLGHWRRGSPHTLYVPALMGPIVGRAVLLVLFVYRTVVVGLVARLFGEFVVTAVLQRTPLEVTVLVMLGLAAYQSRHSLATFARFQEMVFLPILAAGIVALAPAVQNLRTINLLPLLGDEPLRSLAASPATLPSYLGFDVLLFLYGLATTPSGASGGTSRVARAAALSVLITTVVNVVVVEAALAVFGSFELARLRWPLLDLVKTIRVAGAIVERLDAPFVALWVLVVFTTVAAYHFVATHELAAVCGLKMPSMMAVPVSILAFGVAMAPPSTLAAEWATSMASTLGATLTGAVTAAGLLLSRIWGDARSGPAAQTPGTTQPAPRESPAPPRR